MQDSRDVLKCDLSSLNANRLRLSRRRLLRAVGGTALASAIPTLLAACGSSSSTATTSGATTNSQSSGSSGSTAASKSTSTVATNASGTAPTNATSSTADAAGTGTGILVTSVDIANPDPAISHDGATSNLQKHLYDTLYRHTGTPVQLVPWLATGHEVTPDAKEWTFHLDPRAKFQDGSPLTAEDVVYSAQRLIKINQGTAYMFQGILSADGVKAVDDHTVKFTLDSAYAPFLHATAWLFILNSTLVKQHEANGDMGKKWLTTNIAGSGPFVVKRWQPGTLYEFAADPKYWRGWSNPHVASWVFQLMRESSDERLALQQGKANIANWLAVTDIELLQKVPGMVIPNNPGLGVYSIKLNNQRGPTSDVHVRRALSYAFDYKAMLNFMKEQAVPATGPLPPPIQFDKSLTYYTTDLNKAKAELAQAAPQYRNGFDIKFTYVSSIDYERQTGQIMLDQLQQLNIKVTLDPVEWVNAVASFSKASTSPLMFPISSASDFPDPDAYLWASFETSEDGTWTGASWYSNPTVDQQLKQARSTTDQTQRQQLYAQVQKTLLDNAVEIFCFAQVSGAPNRDLVNYQACPVMGSSPWWYAISLKA